jgi:hypothetical protein
MAKAIYGKQRPGVLGKVFARVEFACTFYWRAYAKAAEYHYTLNKVVLCEV